MMKRRLTYLFLMAAVVLATGCSDDDKETVDADLTFYLKDGWAPLGFYTDYGVANKAFHDVCDAPEYYENPQYKEIVELMSHFMLLGADNAATLTPLCSGDTQVEATWSALKVSSGYQFNLTVGGKIVKMRVQSYGGDSLVLYPHGYNLPSEFVFVFERSM